MQGAVRNSWRRRLYRWLTTSARDHRNRVDVVGTHLQAARRERDRVQRLNDVFQSTGKGPQSRGTLEAITLQGRGEGLAWSFVLLPAALALCAIAALTLCTRDERWARQQQAQAEWGQHLTDAAVQRAAADHELRAVREVAADVQAALSVAAEERAHLALLESNMTFIGEKLEKHATLSSRTEA